MVFFPLLFYQAAIRELGSLIVSFLEPFTPVLAYFLQVAIGDTRFNIVTLILLAIASSSIIWFVRIEKRRSDQKIIVATKNNLEQQYANS